MITVPNEIAQPLLIILFAVLPIAFLIWIIIILPILDRRKMNDPNNYIVDVPEDIVESAWVMGKDCRILQTGNYKNPSHHDAYIILFQMQDGTEKELEVPEEDFASIEIGDRGTLMTQNGHYIGFSTGISEE